MTIPQGGGIATCLAAVARLPAPPTTVTETTAEHEESSISPRFARKEPAAVARTRFVICRSPCTARSVTRSRAANPRPTTRTGL
jgi:hypothetical protein